MTCWHQPSTGESGEPETVTFYTAADTTPMRMNVYKPGAGAGPWPAIVVLFGGRWTMGNRFKVDAECRTLAAAGFVAMAADYRLVIPPKVAANGLVVDLADTVTYQVDQDLRWRDAPTGFNLTDVQNAVTYARAQAYTAGHKVGVLGGSSGGHLAAMLGTGSGALGVGSKPDAIACLSGIYELSALPNPAPPESSPYAAARKYIGIEFSAEPASWQAASPKLQIVTAKVPPHMMFNSAQETIPLTQMTAYQTALNALGTPPLEVTATEINGTNHSFKYFDEVSADLIAFFRRWVT